MARPTLAALTSILVCTLAVAAEPPKDTAAAAFTRTQKLKGKVTVDAKNVPLKEILRDISDQLDEQKLRPLSVQYDIGISQNTRTSLSAKDVAADDALDQLLKSLDYGYIVVSKEKDRYDGWIKVVKGTARGYEVGAEPKDAPKSGAKPTDPKSPPPVQPKKPDPPKAEATKPVEPTDPEEEKQAQAKLDSAKQLITAGKAAEAKPILRYVSKFFPKTKAAAEAKKLLDENK